MMYTNFFLFIVAATVFAAAPGDAAPPVERAWALLVTLFLAVVFWEWNRVRFSSLSKRFHERGGDVSAVRGMHHQAVLVQSVLAVGVFFLAVSGFTVKALILQLPLVGSSLFLSHALGIGLFLILLMAVWYWSWRAFDGLMSKAPTAAAHVISQLRFNLVIVIPWLLLSLAADLYGLLPLPAASMQSPAVQAAFFTLFVLMLAVFIPVLMIRLWDCAPLESREMENRLDAFSRKLGVKFRRILSWNAMHRGLVTAGVVGFVPGLRYLLITPALSRLLNEDELLAVVGHEVAHVKRRHMWLYMMFFAGFVVVSLGLVDRVVGWLAGTAPALSMLVRADGRVNTGFLGWGAAFFSLFLFVVYFRFVFGWFMRNFERQADHFCFSAGIPAAHLISAFEKLRDYTGGGEEKGNWHHYSICQRIQWLRRCSDDPGLIARHDRTLRRGLVGFVFVLAVFGAMVLRFDRGAGVDLPLARLEQAVNQRLAKNPGNPALWSLLGNIRLEGENWPGAIAAFQRSLEFHYAQPDTLNNYAWVLLTSPQRKLRDPRLALKLARDAANMRRSHYILDTLAEALLANGRLEEAVAAAREALALADENLDYYENQLKRMRHAVWQRDAEKI